MLVLNMKIEIDWWTVSNWIVIYDDVYQHRWKIIWYARENGKNKESEGIKKFMIQEIDNHVTFIHPYITQAIYTQ